MKFIPIYTATYGLWIDADTRSCSRDYTSPCTISILVRPDTAILAVRKRAARSWAGASRDACLIANDPPRVVCGAGYRPDD
jgi:hypothetical protein